MRTYVAFLIFIFCCYGLFARQVFQEEEVDFVKSLLPVCKGEETYKLEVIAFFTPLPYEGFKYPQDYPYSFIIQVWGESGEAIDATDAIYIGKKGRIYILDGWIDRCQWIRIYDSEGNACGTIVTQNWKPEWGKPQKILYIEPEKKIYVKYRGKIVKILWDGECSLVGKVEENKLRYTGEDMKERLILEKAMIKNVRIIGLNEEPEFLYMDKKRHILYLENSKGNAKDSVFIPFCLFPASLQKVKEAFQKFKETGKVNTAVIDIIPIGKDKEKNVYLYVKCALGNNKVVKLSPSGEITCEISPLYKKTEYKIGDWVVDKDGNLYTLIFWRKAVSYTHLTLPTTERV